MTTLLDRFTGTASEPEETRLASSSAVRRGFQPVTTLLEGAQVEVRGSPAG